MMREPFSAAWPQDGTIFPISSVEIAVSPDPHPMIAAHGPEIEANWALEKAANPAFFNGDMLLHRGLSLDGDGRLCGHAHLTPYAAMLWWRKQPARPIAEHLFSIAVPVTRDGALLAIRMGAQTANPGRVYCAGGSLDAHDIRDGRADLAGNMLREVLEETGIDLAQAEPAPELHGLRLNRAVTVFRFFALDLTADEAVARIEAHMEQDHEKEIAGPVIIRDAETQGRGYAGFMVPILKRFFAGRDV